MFYIGSFASVLKKQFLLKTELIWMQTTRKEWVDVSGVCGGWGELSSYMEAIPDRPWVGVRFQIVLLGWGLGWPLQNILPCHPIIRHRIPSRPQYNSNHTLSAPSYLWRESLVVKYPFNAQKHKTSHGKKTNIAWIFQGIKLFFQSTKIRERKNNNWKKKQPHTQ